MGQDLTINFEDAPQRWEYLLHTTTQDELPADLGEIGHDGWELVQGFPCAVKIPDVATTIIVNGRPAQGVPGVMLIFKRPMARLQPAGNQLATSDN